MLGHGRNQHDEEVVERERPCHEGKGEVAHRRRAERDDLQARGKAFIASEREKAEQAKAPKQPTPEKAPEPERTPQPEPEQRKPRGHER